MFVYIVTKLWINNRYVSLAFSPDVIGKIYNELENTEEELAKICIQPLELFGTRSYIEYIWQKP